MARQTKKTRAWECLQCIAKRKKIRRLDDEILELKRTLYIRTQDLENTRKDLRLARSEINHDDD